MERVLQAIKSGQFESKLSLGLLQLAMRLLFSEIKETRLIMAQPPPYTKRCDDSGATLDDIVQHMIIICIQFWSDYFAET